MDQQILQPLTALENSLTALVQSLTNSNTFAAAPHAASDLVEADDALVSSLLALQSHQENYATILRLRAEAESLQSNLRDIVQTCIDFRTQLGNIDARILEDDDSEDEDERVNEVDYATLITFATRIGRHNTIAAHEAERQAEELSLETQQRRARSKSQSATPRPHLNGTAAGQQADDGEARGLRANDEKQSEVVRTTIAATNQRARAFRQYTYAPFPIHEHLRWGELGRLQILREQQGEEAVDAHIERMVRERELGEEVGSTDVVQPRTEERRVQPPDRGDGRAQQVETRTQQAPRAAVQLDLDFPGGDSDGEDEDD